MPELGRPQAAPDLAADHIDLRQGLFGGDDQDLLGLDQLEGKQGRLGEYPEQADQQVDVRPLNVSRVGLGRLHHIVVHLDQPVPGSLLHRSSVPVGLLPPEDALVPVKLVFRVSIKAGYQPEKITSVLRTVRRNSIQIHH